MDIDERAVADVEDYARWVAQTLARDVRITSGTSLERAWDGTASVVDAIEISRDVYWAMDFHGRRKTFVSGKPTTQAASLGSAVHMPARWRPPIGSQIQARRLLQAHHAKAWSHPMNPIRG
jgi:hypothetical protein